MHGGHTRLLRTVLSLGLICGVAATCGPYERAGPFEERTMARVVAGIPGSGAELAATPVRSSSTGEPDLPSEDEAVPVGVRGRITVGSVGLGGVALRLVTEAGDVHRTESASGRSDQRGRFAFDSLPPGRHRLSLELPPSTGIAFADTSVVVTAAPVGGDASARFRGRLRTDARIRGVVRDRGGAPVGGVRVEVAGHALEGYAADVHPSLASLAWADTTVTDATGRYSVAVPPGWYRVQIWRDEWLRSGRFLRYQYRSPMPAVAPGDVKTEDFDFPTFDAEECTVGRLKYGDRVEREPGAMACGEPLHPRLTRFEGWSFQGKAGEGIRITTDLPDGAPVLLLGPDGSVVARIGGVVPAAEGRTPDGPRERTLEATLDRDGRHRLVITYAGPVWSTPDSYRLRLEGPGTET